MATPSSSATSPSPPMTYLLHNPAPSSQPVTSSPTDSLEREQRQKAIKKFLARAEISMVTRALRTRLSYASYKATHNIHHASIRDLEAQSQSQSQAASFSRTIAAKRKATSTSHHHHAPQGLHGSATGPAFVRRAGSAAMPPPASTSPRTYYPAANGTQYAATSHRDVGSGSRNPTSSHSLYTSILAPPPTHQARTIHNAGDPPVPAPTRPIPSPRVSPPKTMSRSPAETVRSHVKNRKPNSASSTASPRRKAKGPSMDKGKRKQRPSTTRDVDGDGDVDMKAAATLTSLLLHHRPSIGSASSPRSSIDGSEPGSTYSYPHFQQSSARTISTNSPDTVPTVVPASIVSESSVRAQTPPPVPTSRSTSTPHPAPTDSEAANLMLYLATSPSPARPANKDSRDAEAFRALGGGPGVLRDKGRVLFASTGPEPKGSSEYTRALPSGRSGDNSFTSSISSIGSDIGGGHDSLPRSSPSQLLPPPTLPSRVSPSRSPPTQRDTNQSPRPALSQGAVEFNFSDFIHGSPSPLRGTTVPGPKANLGLRADVGRKLFEEEQMRHALSISQSPSKRREEPNLRAGIDLVKT